MGWVGDRWRPGPWPRAPLAWTLVSRSRIVPGASGGVVATGLEDSSPSSPNLFLFTYPKYLVPCLFQGLNLLQALKVGRKRGCLQHTGCLGFLDDPCFPPNSLKEMASYRPADFIFSGLYESQFIQDQSLLPTLPQ